MCRYQEGELIGSSCAVCLEEITPGIDMHIDMRVDMRAEVCIDIHIDMRSGSCVKVCTDMHTEMGRDHTVHTAV